VSAAGSTIRNQLVALLGDDAAPLLAHFEPVTLEFRAKLLEANQQIPYVYFFDAGVGSLITSLQEGGWIEVGTVGREGLLGVQAVLGDSVSPTHAFVQIAGHGNRIESERLRRIMRDSPKIERVFLRYVQAFLSQVSQGTACNRAHSIEERCARWLLMTHDRVDGNQFELTQEFLGQMLGVRRASVNVVATLLQRAGYITYARGRVTIVDRGGLEGAACECYAAIRENYVRLLGEAG
jgi:CRP-like cAMP-binding protein